MVVGGESESWALRPVVGRWEAPWSRPQSTSLEPRAAHFTVHFTTMLSKPMVSLSLLPSWRRTWRALRLRLVPGRVDFVYSRDYQLHLPGVPYDPLRGERVLAYLSGERLLSNRGVLAPSPATLAALLQVHSEDYLESLRDPGALTRLLGLQLDEATQDAVLELQRLMTGGTMLAVRRVRSTGRVTVNLGGGFHHAYASRGERFCVLNDVAVAIADERQRGFDGRVLVVDLDLHDSDGIRSIFAEDRRVHTFSIHNQTNRPPSAEEATVVELGHAVDDATYLEALSSRLPPVFEAFRPRLVIYVAGVDPASDDEIGDWKISAAALLERDRRVVKLTRSGRHRALLAVVLGGGYGSEAWRYTARFCAWLITGDEVPEPPSTEQVTLSRYRNLARLLTSEELTGEPESGWSLTEEDIYGSLAGPPSPTHFLGYYSRYGIELALEKSGILARLRSLGFRRPTLDLDLLNPTGQTVRLFSDPSRNELLVEVRARRDLQTLPGLEMLRIEWLLLQNPRAHFSPKRSRLPGQRHPGLGMLADATAFLVLACERLELDGLLFVPSHYHLAAQSAALLRFVEPRDEARFRAFRRALEGCCLAEATRMLEQCRVIDETTGEAVPWQPAPMVLAVSERLQQRVMGEEYERQVEAAEAQLRLRLAPP